MEYMEKGKDGPPITFKDSIDIQGLPTSAGSELLSNFKMTESSEIYKRLEPHCHFVGKTNMNELSDGTCGINESHTFGTVKNALDKTRIAGGSSSGAAVSVKMGGGIAAIGTDTCGSIRIPASHNGLVGYVPSKKGDWPHDNFGFNMCPKYDRLGSLTHTVQDALWIHNKVTGEEIEE